MTGTSCPTVEAHPETFAHRRPRPLRPAAAHRRDQKQRRRHRRPPHPRRRRQGGARLRLRLQGAAVLPAPDRARGGTPQMDGRAEDRPSDRRHLAGHLRLRPAARRTASPGTACSTTPWRNGPPTTRRRFSWISSVPLTDAEAAAAELERSAEHRRDRRHHLLQHRGREPRRVSARSVLAQGRGARPSHPDPSGECRARPAHRRNSRSPRSRSTPTTPRSASARC